MEEASGQALNTVWPTLSDKKKLAVINDIVALQKRLFEGSRRFSFYGSLYFTQDASRLGLLHENISSQSEPAKYCIGPLAGQHLMKAGLEASGVNCGPWRTAYEYLEALIASSAVQVEQNSDGRLKSRPFSFPAGPVSDTSPAAMIQMLDSLQKAMICIFTPVSAQYDPILWHRDLHFGNIFVSPEGKVICVIDWQDTTLLPLGLTVQIPRFVDIDHDEILLELPKGLRDMPTSTQDTFVDRFRRSMLQQYYMATLQEQAATIVDALTNPAHNLMGQAEAFAQVSHGYEDEVLLLRQCLIDLRRHWPELFAGEAPECPIILSDSELERHKIDGGYYNEFKDRLLEEHIPIADDGWVHQDEFHECLIALEKVVERTMRSFDNKSQQEEFRSRLNMWEVSGR